MARSGTLCCAVLLGVWLSIAPMAGGLSLADEIGEQKGSKIPDPIRAEVKVEQPAEQLRAENISYNIPMLIGSKKQGLVQITPKEEQEINQLLLQNKGLGLIRLASMLAAKGEGFNDFTWKSVYMAYGVTRRGECRVKLQKSLYIRDIKHCDPIKNVRSVQYAYIKYNNWDIAFDRFMTIVERSAQVVGIALPLSLRGY